MMLLAVAVMSTALGENHQSVRAVEASGQLEVGNPHGDTRPGLGRAVRRAVIGSATASLLTGTGSAALVNGFASQQRAIGMTKPSVRDPSFQLAATRGWGLPRRTSAFVADGLRLPELEEGGGPPRVPSVNSGGSSDGSGDGSGDDAGFRLPMLQAWPSRPHFEAEVTQQFESLLKRVTAFAKAQQERVTNFVKGQARRPGDFVADSIEREVKEYIAQLPPLQKLAVMFDVMSSVWTFVMTTKGGPLRQVGPVSVLLWRHLTIKHVLGEPRGEFEAQLFASRTPEGHRQLVAAEDGAKKVLTEQLGGKYGPLLLASWVHRLKTGKSAALSDAVHKLQHAQRRAETPEPWVVAPQAWDFEAHPWDWD